MIHDLFVNHIGIYDGMGKKLKQLIMLTKSERQKFWCFAMVRQWVAFVNKTDTSSVMVCPLHVKLESIEGAFLRVKQVSTIGAIAAYGLH